MIPLTLAEVAEATGGTLAPGTDPAAVVTGHVVIDSRTIGPGDLFVAISGERVDGHDFAAPAVAAGAVAVLAARALDDVPAVIVADPTRALGRLARAVRDRLTGLTVIGVTGSAGKTGTKDLLAAVLATAGPTVAPRGSFNNEIGNPLTVLQADEQTRFLISEMGARAVGDITYLTGVAGPSIGVVLNVGSAHLGEFGSADGIARAKGEMVEALDAHGVAVLNLDDHRVAAMHTRTRARVVYTGLDARAHVRAEHVELDAQARPGFDLVTPAGSAHVQLRLHGEHQVPNALAAAAVGVEAGLAPAQIARALSEAGEASRWRMEVRRRDDGLVVVNDAYNANPESVAAALRATAAIAAADTPPARRLAVLGEMLELGPDAPARHEAAGRLAAELGFDVVVAIGPGAAGVAEGARAGRVADVRTAPDVPAAIELTRAAVRGGDVVLVKASRGVGLERLAAALLDGPPGPAGAASTAVSGAVSAAATTGTDAPASSAVP